MRFWRCPTCGRERIFEYGIDEKTIMKICSCCQECMEVVDGKERS